MRKILRPKIWSQGTPLGSLGPYLRKHPTKDFQNMIFNWFGTHDFPKLVAWETQAKKLKRTAAQCGYTHEKVEYYRFMVPTSSNGGRSSQLEKQVQTEYPVWHFFTFVGNIGGSLGLLVGFSFMGVIVGCLDIISKAWVHCNRPNRK